VIAFKFSTEFHHITGDTLKMFKVKGQRSKSQRKVMYQQQKRYNTAMDRFSDFKLGMASWLTRKRAGVARAASSCNAFAIATFSSYEYNDIQLSFKVPNKGANRQSMFDFVLIFCTVRKCSMYFFQIHSNSVVTWHRMICNSNLAMTVENNNLRMTSFQWSVSPN